MAAIWPYRPDRRRLPLLSLSRTDADAALNDACPGADGWSSPDLPFHFPLMFLLWGARLCTSQTTENGDSRTPCFEGTLDSGKLREPDSLNPRFPWDCITKT